MAIRILTALFLFITLLPQQLSADPNLTSEQLLFSLEKDERYNREYVGTWLEILGATSLTAGLLTADSQPQHNALSMGATFLAAGLYFQYLFKTPAEAAYAAYQQNPSQDIEALLKNLHAEQSQQRQKAGWALTATSLLIQFGDDRHKTQWSALFLGMGLAHLLQTTATEKRLIDHLNQPKTLKAHIYPTRQGLRISLATPI